MRFLVKCLSVGILYFSHYKGSGKIWTAFSPGTENMKIFITGATGYIGQRLTEELLRQGHEVHALCRQRPDFPSFRRPEFYFYQGDLFDMHALNAAMKNCEAVFHLAAIAKVWMPSRGQYYDVNVKGTVNVLDAALDNNVQKIVFTSSAAVYGTSNGRLLTEEDVRTQPFFTDYESSKFIAEERIQHYVRRGLNVVIVHPTKVYGPGIWTESNAVSQMIKGYIEGKWRIIPGDGKMVGNFSYIDDVLNGHIAALESGRPGEKYILGGVNVSFNDFFKQLRNISGKDFFTFHVPYPLMMLYGMKEEFVNTISGKEPKITRPWIEKYNHDLALSSAKAERELGYVITPLDKGLEKTLEWILGQK
jgi:farnesol dehydrogenase